MRPFPGLVIRSRAKRLHVEWRTWEGVHRHRFADPHAVGLHAILPAANLLTIIVLGENKICLHPWNPLARINQQFADPFRTHPAVLVQLVASRVCNRFNAALDGYGVGPPQQIKFLFIPKVDAALESDAYL